MIPRGRSWAKAAGDFGIGRPKRNERKQPEQRRRRPRDGEIGPLPLRLDAEMRAALLECRFDGPTMDESSENLDWCRIEISAQKCLRIAHPRGIAHEHPAYRRRRQPGMIPDRRSSRDLENASFIAIPIGHRQPGPARRFVFEHLGELGQRASFLGRPSALSRTAFKRWREEVRVEPQPRDETDMTANRGDQIERCETGVGDDDDLAIWHPSPNLENGLASPIGQLFVTVLACGVVTFGRRQNCQEGQGPAPPRPWNGNHGHERKPAQAARLDEMTVRGAHGVAIDAARGDLAAPATFDCVVDPDYHRPARQEPVEDRRQQRAGDGATVPSRPAEHIVVEREIAGRAEAHDAQGGAHRALAGREHHADDEHQHVLPNRGRKEALEGRHQRNDDRRQDRCRGG